MYEKFAKLLIQNHISANAVSKATGISSSTFTEWKKGRYTPKLDKLQKIADFFGVDVTYFLDTSTLESNSIALGIDVDAEKAYFYSLPQDKASKEIIDSLNTLSYEQKSAILAVIKSFNSQSKN